MGSTGFKQQLLLALVLLPITFALWYASAQLLVAPASFICDWILHLWLNNLVTSTGLADTTLVVTTNLGSLNGAIVPAKTAGNVITFEIDTNLVSYSLPFYTALLWASRVDRQLDKFVLGLVVMWVLMAISLGSMIAKEMMFAIPESFAMAAGNPSRHIVALAYQFNVLLMPTLAPVALWLFQLRGSPLWEELSRRLEEASTTKSG